MVEIVGQPVNRGAGMGMEVPCIYHLFGPKKYLKTLEEVIKNDFSSVREWISLDSVSVVGVQTGCDNMWLMAYYLRLDPCTELVPFLPT